jgi:hypothetical protein
VYGTKVHTEMKDRIKALDRKDLHTEESYLNGKHVPYGKPGSIRADVIEGSKTQPSAVYDLKTGNAKLTDARIKELRKQLPYGDTINVHETKP